MTLKAFVENYYGNYPIVVQQQGDQENPYGKMYEHPLIEISPEIKSKKLLAVYPWTRDCIVVVIEK